MSDVFTNLVAQSLSSRVEIQPLIPPLFASAPQLFSDMALLSPNDESAVAAENAPFSIPPSIFAGEMTGTSELEQSPEETLSLSSEKRTILPDLVPPDVPQNAVSTLSLRNLLHPQHLTQARMEQVSPTSPPSTYAPTLEEPSLEDMHTLASLPDAPVEGEASRGGADIDPSRPLSMNRLVLGHTQETSPSGIIPNAPETLLSFTLHDDAKRMPENSFHTAFTERDSQHTSREDDPVAHMGEASRFQNVSPTVDKPIASLPIQPASPTSPPSSQPPAPPKHIVNLDELTDQQSSSLVHPSLEAIIARPLTGQSIVSTTDVSVPMPTQQTSIDGQDRQTGRGQVSPLLSLPDSPLYTDLAIQLVYSRGDSLRSPRSPQKSQAILNPTTTIQPPVLPATVPPHVSQEIPEASVKPSTAHINPSASTAPGALHSPRVSPDQEYVVPKEEFDLPPIRITIGRVVVRATPAARPTPAQKRVLRPAQSLSEYLKQRERGSQ